MLIPIEPSWRTQTVVEICQQIRESQDRSGLPVLADALQEAGCEVDILLSALRAHDLQEGAAALWVARVMRAPSAIAAAWFYDLSTALDPVTSGGWGHDDGPRYFASPAPADLIDMAFKYLDTGEEASFGIAWSNAMTDYDADFWARFEVATGRKVNDATARADFYSCDCW